MASAEVVAFLHEPVSGTDTMVADLCSWQDVYTSYGCSVEFDADSDDDGG